MQRALLIIAFIATVSINPFEAFGQKKLKLKHSDQLSGSNINGERIDRLKGNVVFTQNKTTIYCDSSYYYKTKNIIEAFGRVRITEGDSVTITANKLEYDGNTKK